MCGLVHDHVLNSATQVLTDKNVITSYTIKQWQVQDL
jgi:hypothetical protein